MEDLPAGGADDEEINEFIQNFGQVALLVSAVHNSSFSGWVKFRLGAQLDSKKLGWIFEETQEKKKCRMKLPKEFFFLHLGSVCRAFAMSTILTITVLMPLPRPEENNRHGINVGGNEPRVIYLQF